MTAAAESRNWYPYAWALVSAHLADARAREEMLIPEIVLAWMESAEQTAKCIHVVCPLCESQPGQLCRDSHGLTPLAAHEARVDLARHPITV